MRGKNIKKKWLAAVSLLFVFLVGVTPSLLHAQEPAQVPAKTFSLVYSNNLNAEIDPCPT
jgi:hypothetical protein